MRFLLVEPYDTGSHAVWMRGYQAHSAHEVEILSLDGQFWQWRMLGGAAELAGQFLRRGREPDLIVASDMLDLTTFLALTRPHTARIPTAVYFHENQITYPAGPRQKEQQHYAFINAMSALAADAVFFNSAFHRADFLRDLPGLLNHFPDHRLPGTSEAIRAKSAVLPVGIDLARYDAHRPAAPRDPSRPLLIVWNHRWEYDKNPETFFAALDVLAGEGVPFEVALVGENTRQSVPEFDAARDRLGSRVVQYGYVDAFADYARLLWDADTVVSTAIQDFFGISVAEAIYCGCWPVLARRLNYPALVPDAFHAETLFEDETGLVDLLRARLCDPRPVPDALRAHVARYDWRTLAAEYDRVLAGIAITSR
ncbi:MAG: DUF3524 domain-containing protein [Chloroflexota bacterium]